MAIIAVDSRYVNALIYVVVDVAVFAILVMTLTSIQAWSIRRRLLNGERISLREHRISPLTGGVIEDGNRLSKLLVFVHFLLLALLFVFALGINGQTTKAKRPANRQYISKLDPLTARVLFDNSMHPQIISSCTEFSNEILTYYPIAFDKQNMSSAPVSELNLAESPYDEIGTAVDSASVLCQAHDRAKPLLKVSKCGTDWKSCCNLRISRPTRISLMTGKGSPKVWQRNEVHRNYSSLIMTRNVRPVSYDMSATVYDRLICLDLYRFSSPESARMNCMLGTWTAGGTSFTFLLGKATFAQTKREQVMNTNKRTEVSFEAFSEEATIEWDAEAEIILSNGLHSISDNMVPVRLFLDTFVSRSSVPVNVTNEVIYEEFDMDVTDVKTFAIVGYSILIVLAILMLLFLLVNLSKSSVKEKDGPVIPDITSYGGLLKLLQDEETRKHDRHPKRPKVQFGITSAGTIFSIGPVSDNMKTARLPTDGLLRWHRSSTDLTDLTKNTNDDETLSNCSDMQQ